MNVVTRMPSSVDEFLAWEREQELRFEFDGVRAVPMNGGTFAHSEIATNIVESLRQMLSPPLRAIRGDLKVVVADRIRYPDVIVSRSSINLKDDIVPDPIVVFEVLSTSTRDIDLVEKKEEYRRTIGIEHYVVLEQTRAEAIVFTRSGDRWTEHPVRPGGVMSLPAIGIELELARAYAGLDLT